MGLAVGIYVVGAVGLFSALLSPTYVRPPTVTTVTTVTFDTYDASQQRAVRPDSRGLE
jgi:hypothetical protein